MTTRTRLAAAACVPLLLVLGACGDGDDEATSEDSSAGGPPPCSDFANGETITEELSLAGCQGEGVSVNESTRCGDGYQLVAVGPVYGFVGKPANYLGDGEDATQSAEWEQFKQECPYDSE